MRRIIEIDKNGTSGKFLIPKGSSSFWVMSITGEFDNTSIEIEYSLNCKEWITASHGYDNLLITKPEAINIASGLYYRVNVSGYVAPIKITTRPR